MSLAQWLSRRGREEPVPAGMTRRHFLEHLAGASALALPAISFTEALAANRTQLQRRHKAAILLWMNGGPSTIDMFDMKPGAKTAGEFKPASTAIPGVQMCEHLPHLAKQMKQLTIIRSMSTREADHQRGRYYMHTGYPPNPSIEHPSYGSIVSHELAPSIPWLEIPPFVSIGGGNTGPGFLGMTYAPFVVGHDGNVRNLEPSGIDTGRIVRRMQMLATIERGFTAENRGPSPGDHAKVLNKTLSMMTSQQMMAFKYEQEPENVQERYGKNAFGRGCLMARRLVEVGVPFVEVDFDGWDHHKGIFGYLTKDKLPRLDKGMSALVEDLAQRGMLKDTAVILMGEFGRTPRINKDGGRDHYAKAWSVVVAGGGFTAGAVIGQTNKDGTEIEGEKYTAQDLLASVLKALGIPLDKDYMSRGGRPMNIANSGQPIKGLFA
jgi:hypothetical protein